MVNREKLQQRFLQDYNRLNLQQKEAVDHLEGPVMVIAGPGTGKTQILSARIAKILLDTDYSPSNILCLTYTDAGVLAMRKRLLGMIGPEAYSVNLHSFHSFCNMVIQQNMHLFHKRDLQPISDLEQLQCLVQLIDDLENTHPLKRFKSDAYYEATHLKNLFSAMKREGWKGEYLQKKVDEYIHEFIPELFCNKIKKKKGIMELTAEGRKEIEKMERLKAAVKLFPDYEAILKEKQRYDFDDMINWVVKVFEEQPEVLLSYQEQYQFILVDEYQDTSGLQNKLVEQLISYWEDENPNIFVVGDDDQSIFRFQGANMENMKLLEKKYEKDIKRVVLTNNYRSTQPILDAAQLLIQNNKQRLCEQDKKLQKILTAAREGFAEIKTPPVVRSFSSEFEENIQVAEEIRELIDSGIAPGKIAIIYKEHKTGEELQKFFQLQNIPFYSKRSINLLQETFIKKVLSFMEYVVAETEIPFSGEPLLFNMLHYDFYKLPSLKIAGICSDITDNAKRRQEPRHLRSYLAQLASQPQVQLFASDADEEQMIQLHKVLEKLISEEKNLPLLRWMELMFNDAGILRYIMNHPEKALLMQMLNCFFDYIQDECRRDKDLSLKSLCRQIDLLKENNLSIPLVQTNGNENGVNMLSCHGSKGLEYEHVFLMGCYSALWEGKKKNNSGFKIPPNVFEKDSLQETEEELRRLFFVAATRAEKHLYISYPSFTNEGKSQEASRFIAEMNSEGVVNAEVIKISDDLKLKYSSLRYGIIQQPELERAEKDFINGLLMNFKMNVSALNSFLDCPVRFYYSTLLRVPGAKSEASQFGSSVHDALNHYYNKMMEAKKHPPVEIMTSRFKWHLENNREVFKPENFKRYSEYGVQCLQKFHEKVIKTGAGNDFIRTQVPMEAVLGEIPIKGFADKIQYWGNDIIITDYKTGKLSSANKYYQFYPAAHPKRPEGGDYWRQAVFYKLLIDHASGKKKKVLSTEFVFVEPNDNNEYDKRVINVTGEDEQVVQEQIKTVWKKIHAHDFYKGCGKTDCDWCNFVKDHKLFTELHDVEDEVIDFGAHALTIVE